MPVAAPIAERKAHPPLWSSNKGIFADLSDYPKSVSYYVKCPDCGHVHGDFKTLRQAFDHRRCPVCHFDQIEKIKKEVANPKPDKKRVRESVSASTLVRRILEDELDDLDDGLELEPDAISGALDQLGSKDTLLDQSKVSVNWVIDAMLEMEDIVSGAWELGSKFEDAPTNPDDYDHIELTNGRQEWVVYKDVETAEAAALERVKSDLNTEPGLFTESWLEGFVDEDALRSHIGDPYEDWEETEYGDMDYEQKLEALVEHDIIESDDGRFFGEIIDEDDPENPGWGTLEETPERSSLVDDLITELAEKTKPTIEPVEWLKDIYGRDEYMKEVLNAGAIDVDRAADAAIAEDGWVHFMGSYDGNFTELGNGAVAYRVN